MTKRWALKLILAGLLVVALGLRIWGISFGLPYVYHFDERFYVNTALNLGNGILSNPPYNPTGLSNALFPEYAGYYAVGKVMGVFASSAAFEAAYREDPTVFFLMARLTTALCGAATVLALYLLGRTTTDPKTGLVAAGILAVSFLHVRDSHYAVPDIAMSFLVLLAVALAAVGVHKGRRREVYLAGLVGGLAVAMKWTGFPVAIPVWWASVCVESERHKSLLRRLVSRTAILAVLCLAIGFALGSPQILINPAPYFGMAQNLEQAGRDGGTGTGQSVVLDRWLYYGQALFYGVGTVLCVLGIAGVLRRLVLATKSDRRVTVLLLSFPLIYSLFMSFTGYSFARYLLPLVPFIVLFSAETLMAVWDWVKWPKLRWGLAALMIVATTASPIMQSVWHDVLLTRKDTRTLAKQWIEATVPRGSKIAVSWLEYGPPLSSLEWPLPLSDRVYDLHVVGGRGLSAHSPAWYKEQGFEYLVATSFFYNMTQLPWCMCPDRRAFYASLDDKFTLVKEFRHYRGHSEPSFVFEEVYGPAVDLRRRVRPGPTLKIYRIQQQDSG